MSIAVKACRRPLQPSLSHGDALRVPSRGIRAEKAQVGRIVRAGKQPYGDKKGYCRSVQKGPCSLSTRILTVYRVISRAKGHKGRDKKTARAGKSAYVERKVCVGGDARFRVDAVAVASSSSHLIADPSRRGHVTSVR